MRRATLIKASTNAFPLCNALCARVMWEVCKATNQVQSAIPHHSPSSCSRWICCASYKICYDEPPSRLSILNTAGACHSPQRLERMISEGATVRFQVLQWLYKRAHKVKGNRLEFAVGVTLTNFWMSLMMSSAINALLWDLASNSSRCLTERRLASDPGDVSGKVRKPAFRG